MGDADDAEFEGGVNVYCNGYGNGNGTSICQCQTWDDIRRPETKEV